MTRNRITRVLAPAAIVAALAIAGCGSGDDSGGAYGGKEDSAGSEKAASGSEGGAGSGGAVVLAVASAPKLGPVLVDATGFTVYDFHKDKGTTSSCYGACAQVWPPVITEGAPRAGDGVTPSKLGTTERSDGTVQVTYAGHPLYTYKADNEPGEANGHDIDSFGAEWYALQGSGAEAED